MQNLARAVIAAFLSLLFVVMAADVAVAESYSDQGRFESHVSAKEFADIATELAPKVNLFREVWKEQPDAAFFGGTSRDYLYWLKGKLVGKQSRAEVDDEIRKLREQSTIDVREFILFESDVDVVTNEDIELKGERYGIKKIDTISADRLDPRTQAGLDEIKQGFIPVEKILLTSRGITANGAFGNGLQEIYSGRPTVRFASDKDFESTRFAQLGLNHPVLLALRYIRLLAMDHHRKVGPTEVPDLTSLVDSIDPRSEQETSATIEKAIRSGKIGKLLKNDKFQGWMNGTIQKAFRSYTNPTAAKMLMSHFKADLLVAMFPEKLEPINQYLFREPRDAKKIAAARRKFGFDASMLSDLATYFPDGKIYHGTRTEVAFRTILFQGILPSSDGSAGAGLYGVALPDVRFAKDWGGSEDRVVMFELAKNAVFVDVTKGPGKKLFDSYQARAQNHDGYDGFARELGIDIIRYEYSTQAFIVKNGEILKNANGLTRKLMTITEIRDWARRARDFTADEFLSVILDNSLNELEIELLRQDEAVKVVLQKIKNTDLAELLDSSPRLRAIAESGRDIFLLPEIHASLKRSIRKQLKNTAELSAAEAFEGLVRVKRSYSRFGGFEESLDKALVPFVKAIIPKYLDSAGMGTGTPENRLAGVVEFGKVYGTNSALDKPVSEASREFAKGVASEIVARDLGQGLMALQVLERSAELVERYGRGMAHQALVKALEPSVKKATEHYLKKEFLAESDPAKVIEGLRLVNLVHPHGEFFINRFLTEAHRKHFEAAAAFMKTGMRTLTRAQLVDPRNPQGAIAFAGRHHTPFPVATKAEYRKLLIASIPSLFSSMNDTQVQDVMLEAEKNKSRIGWFAAHYELHRRGKTGVLESLAYDINEYSQFGTDPFTEDIFDAIANVHPKKPLPLEFMKRWILQQTSGAGQYLVMRMWKSYPFDEARDMKFVKALARTEAGMHDMLYAISESLSSLQGNRKILPQKWTQIDVLIEKFILESPFPTLRSFGMYLFYPWLNRVAEFGPRNLSSATLVKIYDVDGRPTTKDPNDAIYRADVHEALAKFPQLIDHPRGADLIEEMVGHRNFANSAEYDVDLKKMIETHWKKHPRAAAWLHALTLLRMNRANKSGVIERETYLKSLPMPAFTPVAPPSVGAPKPRVRPAQCRALFAS